VEIDVQVETKGAQHCEQVLQAVKDRGYTLILG
jgi:hypothetical protein